MSGTRTFASALVATALVVLALPSPLAALPSHREPNAPGAIVVPSAISVPPPGGETLRSYEQLLALWHSAGAAYGVPWELLAAINKIESDFGRNMGPSSAGAVGWMQFLPSTWMRWGVDANGDGLADPWNAEDAIFSAARYLAAAGADHDLARAIFAYNHAAWYVDDVLELARAFADGAGYDPTLPTGGGSDDMLLTGSMGALFSVDAIDERLASARRLVAKQQRVLARAEDAVERLEAKVYEAEQRAGDPELTDAEFRRMERRVTHLVRAHEEALRRLTFANERLADAVDALEAIREEAPADVPTVTFVVPETGGDDELAAQRHVFPVGGGPTVVSVPSSHHDYPAVDIAAPEGSPVYALADGVVEATFPSPSGRCGIGLKLRLTDGRAYVYCHLSYLEPTLAAETPVAAGAPLGLVGQTGNATGPHLHLQRVPADVFPQREAWFQAFAGSAFRWQGAPPAAIAEPGAEPGAEPSAREPVFRVVAATPALGFEP
ncbi:MAG: lytic murein transglycosylase [Actinomycetota bacterium]|nr:lytic murein transglycosylase [Actinomycetota bacterium]